jgi:hypothetical protein
MFCRSLFVLFLLAIVLQAPKKSSEADFSRQSRKKSQIATLVTDSVIPAKG